jgi:FkbM family methyltransferase
VKYCDQPAAVLGNGPSLRDFDFVQALRGYVTFGMNVAYRWWDTIDWYPDYYACLDLVVGISHADEICRLIKNKQRYCIKKFLLRGNLIDKLGEYGRLPFVYNFDALAMNKKSLLSVGPITTGSHTLAWAVEMGFSNIVLLGIDSNYVNFIKEAKQIDGSVLEISEDPEDNPNYFFDGYQRKGDRYNTPNMQTKLDDATHRVSWRNLQKRLRNTDVVVVNANPKSNVEDFPKATFRYAQARLRNIRHNKEKLRNASGLAGPFDRSAGMHCDETMLVRPFLPKNEGIMLDVGAHTGGTCLPLLLDGWTVYAFEPDTANRTQLLKNTRNFHNITVEARAISNEAGRIYPWYISRQSTGICGVLPFDDSHKHTGQVMSVTLHDYCNEYSITHVDYLKIDTEGLDILALRGFPFDSIQPACVMCKFEDRKSAPMLNTTMHELGIVLLRYNYHIYISEWHPIVRYGIPHQWRRFISYPAETIVDSWGNLIAFATQPSPDSLRKALDAALHAGVSMPQT